MAFEKAVIEVLRVDNQKILTNYGINDNDAVNQMYVVDAYTETEINLSCFGMGTYKAENIFIEIKAGRVNEYKVKKIIDIYYNILSNKNSLLVIIWDGKVNLEKYFSHQFYLKIIVIDSRYLSKNRIVKQVLNSFDDYIIQERNVIIDNYFDDFINLSKDVSFALGAGCSIDANISDWNRLSEALGFDLLYNILDDKNSIFKNMYITNELNKKIFASFGKTSSLDVIYNSFINSPSTTKLDYFKKLKNVLYMSYDSPNNSKTPLVTSIVNCIKRKRINEIINYNFDSILEQNNDASYKSSSKEISASKTQINNCEVYHVHGYIPYDYDGQTIVSNFIFTDSDYYDNMINYDSFSNSVQRRIFSRYNVIFVGVSFTDPNIKEILRERKRNRCTNSIFAFLKLPGFEANGKELKIMINKYKLMQQSYFDTLGVKILWVNDYKEISEWINKL